MAIKKIEIQDSTGDVYHPHTTTDVVFHGDTKLFDLLAKFLKKDGSVPVENTLNPLNSNQISLGSTTKVWQNVFIGTNNINPQGYCKLTNGLLIQWGNGPKGVNPGKIGFPVTFPNNVFQVIVTIDASMDGGTIRTFDTNKSNFSYTMQNFDSNSQCSWIAIGY